LVNTGHGKGKSTAAFGVMLRALAREWRVCVIQFIKSDEYKVGEQKMAERLELEAGGGEDRERRLSTRRPRRDHVPDQLGLD
jgi:ATP:corrinoid adenosyltransferase